MRIPDQVLISEKLPRFYGVAWRDPLDCSVVAFPMPFNLIVRWLRGVYAWIEWGHGDRWDAMAAQIRAVGYDKGYERGRAVGIRLGDEAARAEMARKVDDLFAARGYR